MPATDVAQHASIDVDQQAIVDDVDFSPPNFEAAHLAYQGPGGSCKPTRTIQGFSTAAEAKMTGEPEYAETTHSICRRGLPMTAGASPRYDKAVVWYGAFAYANLWVEGALDGRSTDIAQHAGVGAFDGEMGSKDAVRAQAVKKGTVYLNTWMCMPRAQPGHTHAHTRSYCALCALRKRCLADDPLALHGPRALSL